MTLIPPSTGTTFAGLFWDALLSSTGVPAVSTPVTVFESDGSTIATIYSSQSRASQANPINTDAYGNLLFYANPGIYVLSVTLGGVGTTRTVQVDPWFADSPWNVVLDVASASPSFGDCRMANATSAGITETLPAVAQGGRVRVVKTDNSTHSVTVTAPGGASIIGARGAVTSWVLYQQGQTLEVICDGTNFYSINEIPGVMPLGSLSLANPVGNLSSGSPGPFPTGSGSFAATVTGGMASNTALGFASLTVPVAGVYHCCGGVKYALTTTPLVGAGVWQYRSSGTLANGNIVYEPANTSYPTTVAFAMDVRCQAGDNLSPAGYADAGGRPVTSRPGSTLVWCLTDRVVIGGSDGSVV